MLTFVGLGLYDERSVTIEGAKAIRGADRVFAEFYTSILAGTSIETIETYHDTELEVRDRTGIEREPEPILDAAETGDVVFLTAGDTMISTTHVDLRLRAHDLGIETRVIHGTTAQSAASGLTGLQNYRFGKATTLPFPESHGGDGVPESVVTTITANHTRGLHTLVYLDIKAEQEVYLSATRAASLLADAYEDVVAVAIARAGSPSPVVRADQLGELAERDFGDPLHLLVIPAELHDLEREALLAFADAPLNVIDEPR